MSDVCIVRPPQPETAPAERFREQHVTMGKTSDGQPLLKIEVEGDGRAMGGSRTRSFNESILHSTMACLPGLPDDPDAVTRRVTAAHAALAAFAPKDELEGMLAAQAVAMHHAAMECFRRALVPGQHPDAASKLRKDGANLARAVTDMIEALDRKHGKAPQVVRVERVVVHEGGQAVVGNVQPAVMPKVGG